MSRRPGGSSKRSDVDAFTQGRPAEALSAWRRCQRTLSAGLGISPSPETEAIARQSQQQ